MGQIGPHLLRNRGGSHNFANGGEWLEFSPSPFFWLILPGRLEFRAGSLEWAFLDRKGVLVGQIEPPLLRNCDDRTTSPTEVSGLEFSPSPFFCLILPGRLEVEPASLEGAFFDNKGNPGRANRTASAPKLRDRTTSPTHGCPRRLGEPRTRSANGVDKTSILSTSLGL